MALKTNVLDRVSAYPGRVKLTPVSGQDNTYDMVRADQPTQEGTPINKALFDKKADVLTANVTLYVTTSGNDSTADGTSSKPYRTIQAALDSIPKNLGGYVATIDIGAGTYAETVVVDSFSANRIVLGGTVGAVVKINRLDIRNCTVNITNITLTTTVEGVYASTSARVYLDPSTTLICNNGTYGLYARYNSMCTMLGTVEVNNTTSFAFRAGEGCMVFVANVNGVGNNIGLSAKGGILAIGATLMTAATEFAIASGGRVFIGGMTTNGRY